jgi:intermediate cleaving peptidase 55
MILTVSSQHDLTPGIPTEEYDYRRRKLMNNLPENSLVVSVAAPIKYMSASASFPNVVSPRLIFFQIFCEALSFLLELGLMGVQL